MPERLAEPFGVDPRAERPRGRFSLLAVISVAVVATVVVVSFLSAQALPSAEMRVVLMTSWIVLGVVGLIVYRVRARVVADPRLAWASAGITVSVVAAMLHYISHPAVFPTRGPLGTGDQASSVLFVVFNGALFAAGIGALARSSRRSATGFAWVGSALALLIAVSALPMPELLGPGGTYSTLQLRTNLAVGLVGLLVAAAWFRTQSPAATALDSWFGVAMLFASASILVGSVPSQRFDAIWWASLCMRAATFGVLAIGGVLHLAHELRRAEEYSDAELSRREGQLERTSSVTSSLMGSAVRLSRATTPDEVGEVVVRALARLTGSTRGVVAVQRPDGGLKVVVAAGYDDVPLDVVERQLNARGAGIHEAALRDEPLYLAGRAELEAAFPYLQDVDPSRRGGRLAAIPLTAGSERTGVAFVGSDDESPWTPQDRSVVSAVAAQAGPALARALQYAHALDTAEVLQRALLPAELPSAPGVDVTARYLAGDSGANVGGDWYDAVALPDGRVVLLVGDVVGKGVRAATAMGVLRQSVRVLVDRDPSPSSVLCGLERVLAGEQDRSFATVCCLLVDPGAGTVVVARAGHLPPVVVGPDGTSSLLDAALSPPLGAGADRHPEESRTLAPGSVLVLYTDGVVEDRAGDIDERLARLRTLVAESVRDGADLDAVADAAVASRPQGHPDDVAVMVVRVSPPPLAAMQPIAVATPGIAMQHNGGTPVASAGA